ncbi:hypothetical protein FEF33_11410 [Moraxella osloensis]|nr:hypothetical protein FEF33_11410 [Moraxella osloensis]
MNLIVSDKERMKNIVKYQIRQLEHDKNYHTDIVAFSLPKRMTHITLHLAKYAYEIAKVVEHNKSSKSFVDAFIMVVSASNLLKIELADLRVDSQSNDSPVFLDNYLKNLATLSKACESYDHFEKYSYHDKWNEAVRNLYLSFIIQSSVMNIDVIDEANKRLDEVDSFINTGDISLKLKKKLVELDEE